MIKDAILVLADGSQYAGTRFGAKVDAIGELVFNTGMTGYQEALTDPSYQGQMVMLTYPLIGNTGISVPESESIGVHMKGFIIQELCEMPSNWRSDLSLDAFLQQEGVPGLCNVDTRAITRRIRDAGVMNAAITDGPVTDELLARVKGYAIESAVAEVTAKAPYFIPGKDGPTLAILDMGAKQNIVRKLMELGCPLKIYPAATKAEEILSAGCDGVVITNGPGNPEENQYTYAPIRQMMGEKPVFGICLGHQLMALARGGKSEKMAFGHRGANHPVKDHGTGRVYITSQNHGYVCTKEVLPEGAEIRFTSMNDDTVEGYRYENALSVQFHPEAAPGPRETAYLFQEFFQMVKDHKRR
ncbi:carbamoyl phosphate synthase small subunit [Eubacteriales bacterium OttesenSCG-928-M02]|nr:carbamoyl phosphate synthase small subunit [Eubacteriales bacterium OttesenSCG-928-M02]